MSDHPPVPLAHNITVERTPDADGGFRILVDGEPLPTIVAGDKGATVVVSTDNVPGVTITLLAESVTVDDRAMVAQRIEHRHG